MRATDAQLQLAIDALGDKQYVKCPVCKTGKYGGLFYQCCDNGSCALYDSIWMGRCYICGEVRRECCC
jgi:hypothetical protein